MSAHHDTTDPVAQYAASLRLRIAARTDALVGRQRRKWSARRQAEIDQLAEEYRVVYGIQLRLEVSR